LAGKFEISADVSLKGGAQCWLDYGGYAIHPKEKQHRTRIAGGGASQVKAKKKVPRLHSVVQYRIAVDGNNVETYVNDVRVSRHEFDEAPQPWFTLQTQVGNSRPILQNVRITGQPEIPTEIDLLAADRPQWSGSFTRFSEESTEEQNRRSRRRGSTVPAAPWLLKKGELTAGSLKLDLPERYIFKESWLHYQRPMLEDGEFEFEMFADDEKLKLCHVSIGRTALLLKEDGVWRHEIVGYDGAEETEDEKIADSSGVKLKNKDWNQILVRIEGDTATLLVNEQKVASFEVTDAPPLRFPGLFRFSDQSNAQVRSIKYRGDWPKTLPPVEQQELAQHSSDPFEGQIAGDTKVFDLSKSVEDLKTAGLEVKGEAMIESTGSGLKVTARKNVDGENWPSVATEVNSANDFDLSVDFADLKIDKVTGWGCNLDLQIDFDDVEKSAITVGVRRDKDNDLFLMAQREYDQPDGERAYDFTQLFEPFEKGTLRLVRRGSKVYALAAADGKSSRVITSFTIGGVAVSKASVIVKSATDTSELDVVVGEMSLTVAGE
jgi:hypothetical protein